MAEKRCRRQESGRLLCFARLTNGLCLYSAWWNDPSYIQPVIEEWAPDVACPDEAWWQDRGPLGE